MTMAREEGYQKVANKKDLKDAALLSRTWWQANCLVTG
jgi:hypothetical protein